MKLSFNVDKMEDIMQTDTVELKCHPYSGTYVHVLPCRLCKYYNDDDATYENGKLSGIRCTLLKRETKGENYCSWGTM